MDKKILIGSFGAACLLILLTFSPVIGSSTSADSNKATSPLFNIRKNQITHQPMSSIHSSYISKDSKISLFFAHRISFQQNIDRALQYLENNPRFIEKILHELETNPVVRDSLEKYDIT